MPRKYTKMEMKMSRKVQSNLPEFPERRCQ